MAETATEQERLQLYQLLLEPAYSEALAVIITDDLESQRYNNEEDPVMKDLLQRRVATAIQDETVVPVVSIPAVHSRKNWKLYAAAAVFIIMAATLWLLNSNKKSAGSDQQIVKADIAPGHSGAILTLADGSTIILDSAANGTIAVESNTTITKNSDGALAYTPNSQLSSPNVYNTLTTPPGRQFSVALPDGSKVWLNAASSLRYPAAFNGKDRTVEVTGEAYFEIATSATQPFYVKSAGQQVQVLGTSFNINAYSNEPQTKTTLLEGSIRLSCIPGSSVIRHLSSVILGPGEQARLNGQSLTVYEADIQQAVAWKNGLFSFNKVDLATIMRQLARWYDVEVKFEGSPGQEQFTGKIGRNLSLREVMEGLAFTHVKYRIEEGKRIVVLP